MNKEDLETDVLRAFQDNPRWTVAKTNDKNILVWEGAARTWIVVMCVLRNDITKLTATASSPSKGLLFVMSEKAARILWDAKRRSAS